MILKKGTFKTLKCKVFGWWSGVGSWKDIQKHFELWVEKDKRLMDLVGGLQNKRQLLQFALTKATSSSPAAKRQRCKKKQLNTARSWSLFLVWRTKRLIPESVWRFKMFKNSRWTRPLPRFLSRDWIRNNSRPNDRLTIACIDTKWNNAKFPH